MATRVKDPFAAVRERELKKAAREAADALRALSSSDPNYESRQDEIHFRLTLHRNQIKKRYKVGR
jgi:molecular chaperone DnaK (HSP70)